MNAFFHRQTVLLHKSSCTLSSCIEHVSYMLVACVVCILLFFSESWQLTLVVFLIFKKCLYVCSNFYLWLLYLSLYPLVMNITKSSKRKGEWTFYLWEWGADWGTERKPFISSLKSVSCIEGEKSSAPCRSQTFTLGHWSYQINLIRMRRLSQVVHGPPVAMAKVQNLLKNCVLYWGKKNLWIICSRF